LALILPAVSHGQAGADTLAIDPDASEWAEPLPPSVRGIDDSLVSNPRGFDEGRLEELRNNPDFFYGEDAERTETLWSRFRRAFIDWINQFFSTMVNTGWGNILAYGLGALALVFIALRLLDRDAFGWLAPSDSRRLTPAAIEENIHEMNFEELLSEAAAREDYRQGIRLLFLYALRLLSDRNFVFWKPGKTNLDYLAELTEDRLRPGFNRLGYYFDHAWYGQFPVQRQAFLTARETFDEWKRGLTV
jgi:hypothetical protein